MAQNSFAPSNGLGLPSGGLASRRGGQNIKPLSFDAMKASADNKDNGAPTPRTSRSHLLAGLRTAPKSATTGNFPASPTTAAPTGQQSYASNGASSTMYNGQQNAFAGPKTSLPRMPTQPQQQQQHYQQQQQQQQQAYQRQQQMMAAHDHHYTAEQILAPPELAIDEQEQMDPNLYAQLVATNMYLAQQQQRLQQQLMNVQAAAQQFHGLSLNGQATLQQQVALQSLYQQQQQQLRSLQQSMANLQQPQQNMYTCYDPSTGQQMYYVDQNQNQYNQGSVYMDQPSTPQTFSFQQNNSTPRVQVSPPADNERPFFRSNTPPKKVEILTDHEPLPPPSANAFRRGHKKTPSMGASKGLMVNADEATKATGPKTASFPLTPASSGYGPGQARAGEHPLRQPRGPPSIEELRAKPTSKDEGSKNFVARTRRSAIHNLMKAGLERRKGTSSSGSMSPVSDTAEAATPLTDNESDSGRSGSGSLSGDAEPSLASSRTSASGSWGAIGSDRPSSRQKSRKSVDSISSASESDHGSFASVFKHGSHRASKPETSEGGRKARLVLTSGEKRKNGIVA